MSLVYLAALNAFDKIWNGVPIEQRGGVIQAILDRHKLWRDVEEMALKRYPNRVDLFLSMFEPAVRVINPGEVCAPIDETTTSLEGIKNTYVSVDEWRTSTLSGFLYDNEADVYVDFTLSPAHIHLYYDKFTYRVDWSNLDNLALILNQGLEYHLLWSRIADLAITDF